MAEGIVKLGVATPPRVFLMRRDIDETGVSGTGVIAAGVEFTDGVVVIRWLTECRSTTVFASIDELRAIHGHNGKTEVVWTDQCPDCGRWLEQRCALDGTISDDAFLVAES